MNTGRPSSAGITNGARTLARPFFVIAAVKRFVVGAASCDITNLDSLVQLSEHGARTNSLRHMQRTSGVLVYQRENAAAGFPVVGLFEFHPIAPGSAGGPRAITEYHTCTVNTLSRQRTPRRSRGLWDEAKNSNRPTTGFPYSRVVAGGTLFGTPKGVACRDGRGAEERAGSGTYPSCGSHASPEPLVRCFLRIRAVHPR